jgi:hypothetical protein
VQSLTGSRLLWKMSLFGSTAMKGISGWMELIAAVEETSTTMTGGENSCVVATSLLRHPFI